MYQFCTITTADHMYKCRALYDSLRGIHSEVALHILCVDVLHEQEGADHISYYCIQDIVGQPIAATIISKYKHSKDKIRWCLKPVFLAYLLENKAEQVIYIDNDIYFYNDFTFLFDLLSDYNFILTPHHYPRDPDRGQNWLEANFKVGLYNAGFIAVTTDAIPSLNWWAACCAYRCEKNALRGLFDDQKYLDLIPVIDEKAYIVRHKGCNIAEWNKDVISRSEKNGEVMLDGQYPLIFIHFNGTTVRAISEGSEPHLKNAFIKYFKNLKLYNQTLDVHTLMNTKTVMNSLKLTIWKMATWMGL